MDTLIVVGTNPEETIAKFCQVTNCKIPGMGHERPRQGEVFYWRTKTDEPVRWLHLQPARAERQRHRRKYAEGDIHEKSFFFRGPEGKLNLKAQNLAIFLQMADGVDDETWNFHLRQHDYSRWIKDAIKDDDLARQVAQIEVQRLLPKDSRAHIRKAISEKYTNAA